MINTYRFYVALLAFEWIVFGSMHFSPAGAKIVLAELPFDLGKQEIGRHLVVLTGMIEVATGFFIVGRASRRYAALVSLVLLGIYVLPVYNMILNDGPAMGSETWRAFTTTIVVPNNLLLAIASWRLWRDEPPAAQPSDPQNAGASLTRWLAAGTSRLVVAALLLAANCAGFAVLVGSHYRFSIEALWAMMCITGGALLGFLFGVPRVNRRLTSHESLLPNTNIEEISDWATKMIVGIGLANFRNLSDYGWTVTKGLAAALGSSHEFAMALVGYFSLVGVVQGYLLTRIYLADEFDRLSAAAKPVRPRRAARARG